MKQQPQDTADAKTQNLSDEQLDNVVGARRLTTSKIIRKCG